MQTFSNSESLIAHVEEVRRADAPSRENFADGAGRAQSYYVGAQWLQSNVPLAVLQRQDGLGRYLTDWNPDSSKLRATVNRVTKYVTKEAAATHPDTFEIDGTAPESDPSLDAENKARTLEDLANITVGLSGFLAQAQDANLNRAIAGSWGLQCYIDTYDRVVNGQKVPDKCLKVAAFDPARLVLDPACTSRRLADHDEVIYEDTWTLTKVQRVLGVKLDPDKMPEFGTLCAHECNMSRLSRGALYAHYTAYSKTKATRVAQVHLKDATGRFGLMYTLYQDEEREWKVHNFDAPESPYGGNGLPMVLIHGHRRPGSPFGIAAGQMTKDDQDRMNLLWSQFFRHQQKYGSPQVVVDKRLFGQEVSDDEVAQKFTNKIGSVVVTNQRGEKPIDGPSYLTPPQPPPYIADISEKFEADMQQQVARAEGHFGLGAKSHVPYQTTERLLEEADQILGIRVREDARAYEDLLQVAVGTVVKFVQDDVPGTLVNLNDKGFGQDEFATIVGTDSYDLNGCVLKIRESSVRYRSLASKQQSLDTALVNKAIDPMLWRGELATLDIALTTIDNQMQREIARKVQRLVLGEDWQPLPLGEYNVFALTTLRRALFDRRVRDDPAQTARVTEAIVLQEQAVAMEAALQASDGQTGLSSPGQPQEEQQPPDTLGSLLQQVGGQQGVPALPAA